ncbi:hypothetical protein AGABI1DRAFT_102686 [Agaricus bisporus var. burnettii JB137-S8]|uniref:Calpain catalytic domain-containing protein n=1 Tax=Agaricus bisporus var. burnettii (strain JB137-S8 / ATCC MYA-4627 / FGSC 10392) TaxID=597362 RepID=K5WYB9_AGABU|nr:uncharacterized protein AGABI1DRAFT_102686 [Agaricus bisporus var. burnettii JB137-S8]EKM75828.1 hypothetical protein AGABI1DRAFT_102686 [Agaricus bisporus var. burnettii JB137-S8]
MGQLHYVMVQQCSPSTMYSMNSSMEARTAEATYAKATKAELASNYDEAFKHYVKAAELFLHLSRKTHNSEALCSKWKASATKALERAEKIKSFAHRSQGQLEAAAGGSQAVDRGGNGAITNIKLTPIGINHFSEQEQYYVLKRGSLINGLVFPPWDDPVLSTLQSCDWDRQPALSMEHERASAVWRPAFALGRPPDVPGSRELHPLEVLQHIINDCSVCASISVCLDYARRFESNLARSALYSTNEMPISLEAGTAALSLTNNRDLHGSRRYYAKLFMNGIWRRVTIDDSLPYNPSEECFMCMTIYHLDGGGEKIHWPSLIEKSYMKLMGGYDFPGSNSSIDLHALIGWIPEQIDTKSTTFERERTWERLTSGYKNGKCLVTIGTGDRQEIYWRETPLLRSHSYAVIDIDEDEKDRVFTVLDSWVRPDDKELSRVLKIPWSEVVYIFDGIYLSWDPGMWKHQINFHGDANHNLRISFVNVNAQTEEEIWILLTRHVRETRCTTDFICLRAELEDSALPPSARLNQQYQLSNTGTYTNSTHVLNKIRIQPTHRSGVVAVTASYEGDKDAREIGFSVVVYSGGSVQVAWDENTNTPPYMTRVDGTLTTKNSGGNSTYPTFMVNPQYHLRIHPSTNSSARGTSKKSRTRVLLKAGKDIPANAVIVWSKGDRKDELIEKEVAASSGAYMYGYAQIIKDLMPGDYTLIISAFEPRHTGPFTLKVECSTSFDLKSIPQEGAGMYSKIVKGAWNAKASLGGPAFEKYALSTRFELMLPMPGQVRVRLQLFEPSNSSVPINVAIYKPSTSRSPSAGPVATSGAYGESLAGVAIPLATLAKGTYHIVPSTYGSNIVAEFRLIIYSNVNGFEVKSIQ